MKFLIWLLCVVGVEGTGLVSSAFAGDIRSVYANLNKPPLAPPGEIVGIIWTILYALMGTSLSLVITSSADSSIRRTALIWFGIQQVLNFVWSIIFFGGQHFYAAVVVNVLLLIAIVIFMSYAKKVSPLAMYLFIPYLLWCAYATYLALGLAIRN